MSSWTIARGPQVHLVGQSCQLDASAKYFGSSFTCNRLRAGDAAEAAGNALGTEPTAPTAPTAASVNIADTLANNGTELKGGGAARRRAHKGPHKHSSARRKTVRK